MEIGHFGSQGVERNMDTHSSYHVAFGRSELQARIFQDLLSRVSTSSRYQWMYETALSYELVRHVQVGVTTEILSSPFPALSYDVASRRKSSAMKILMSMVEKLPLLHGPRRTSTGCDSM